MEVPKSDLYCPVCGNDVEFISLWEDPDGRRIRLFCDDCSHQPAYQSLRKEECQILNLESFQRFAGARQLRNAFEHEHPGPFSRPEGRRT